MYNSVEFCAILCVVKFTCVFWVFEDHGVFSDEIEHNAAPLFRGDVAFVVQMWVQDSYKGNYN